MKHTLPGTVLRMLVIIAMITGCMVRAQSSANDSTVKVERNEYVLDDAISMAQALSELLVLHECMTTGIKTAVSRFATGELQGVFAVEEIVKTVIQTRKLLELFCQQFSEFREAIGTRVETGTIERFNLICSKLEKIETDLKVHDRKVCSKIATIDQQVNQKGDDITALISTVQRDITTKNDALIVKLCDAQTKQTILNQNMCARLSAVQKSVSDLCLTLLSKLQVSVLDQASNESLEISQVQKSLSLKNKDLCEILAQAQINIQHAFDMQSQDVLGKLTIQSTILKAKLCAFEQMLSAIIVRQGKALERAAAIHSNNLCRKFTELQTIMALDHEELERFFSEFSTSLQKENEMASAKLFNTQLIIDKRLILEFGELEASVVAAINELITKIALIHDDVITLLEKEFSQLECALAINQDSVTSKLISIETMLELGAKSGFGQLCEQVLQGVNNMTSKVAVLESDTQLFNCQIANQLEKIEANIIGSLCRKMSDFERSQYGSTGQVAQLLSAVELGMTNQVTSKMSQLTTDLSGQSDALRSKLVSLESCVKNEAGRDFARFECNIAMRQAVLCSKISTIQAHLINSTDTHVSDFGVGVAGQLDALCSKLIQAEIAIVETTQSAIDGSISASDACLAKFCSRVDDAQEELEQDQQELCQKLFDLDAELASLIDEQAGEVCDDLESRITKAEGILIALDVLTFSTAFLAGKTAPVVP